MSLIEPHGKYVEVDIRTTQEANKGYLVSINSVHHKIHEGSSYVAYAFDDEVDADAPKQFMLRNGSPSTVHFRAELSTSGPALIETYAFFTIVDDGTPLIVVNRDLGNPNQSEVVVFNDNTVSDDGVVGYLQWLGSEGVSAQGSSGGVTSATEEFLYPPGLETLYRISPTYNGTKLTLSFEWYEVG